MVQQGFFGAGPLWRAALISCFVTLSSVKSWIYQKPCRDFWLHVAAVAAAALEKHAAVFQESIAKPVCPSFPLEFSI